MILKCIGGPNHREYHDVPAEYREHDLFRIMCYSKLSVLSAPLPSFPDSVKIENNFYLVSIIKYKEENQPVDEFKFLRYKGISISEALRIALVY